MALAIGAAVAQAYGAYNVRDLVQLTQAAVTNGYQRYLENQADRLGMEYMIAAGYDPREAPRAWKAVSLKQGDSPINFFWSNHDNNTTRRSYLMAELKNNYAGQTFGSMKKDSEGFEAARSVVQSMHAKNIKIKVKH
jgi:predicted Zn-dependent protease